MSDAGTTADAAPVGPGAVAVGDVLPEREVTITQADVIRYAGASGDFNPLHWDPEVATRVSPTGGTIVHGMMSLAVLGGWLDAWAGGPGRVRTLKGVFKAPCPVGATVTLGGEVLSRDGRTLEIAVWATTADGARVVDRKGSRAIVLLDAPVAGSDPTPV